MIAFLNAGFIGLVLGAGPVGLLTISGDSCLYPKTLCFGGEEGEEEGGGSLVCDVHRFCFFLCY